MMKKIIFVRKITKIFIFLFLSLFLFSCNQFATNEDKARVMFAYDYYFENEVILNGTTEYGHLNNDKEIKEKKALFYKEINGKKIYRWQNHKSKLLEKIKKIAIDNKITIPNDEYWFFLDDFLLQEVLNENKKQKIVDIQNCKDYKDYLQKLDYIFRKFGYIKYYANNKFFNKMREWKKNIFKKNNIKLGDDFEKLYEETIQKEIENISSYISLRKDLPYGNFGFYNKNTIYLEPKNWNSLKFSSFDFIFIYPMTYLIEKIIILFGNNSFSKILSIFTIIFIIRFIMMLLFSIRAGVDQQKIKILQSDLEKINEKFSNYEPQFQKKLFSQEQSKIFKKNNINSFFIFIDFIFKFFSFIFISNTIRASAILTTGNFFNLSFNRSIKDAIFQRPGISNGWLTGLIIFVIIILIQIFSIIISNFFQKKICSRYNKNLIMIQKKNRSFTPFIIFGVLTIVGFFLSINISINIVCNSILDILQTLMIYLILKKYKKEGV